MTFDPHKPVRTRDGRHAKFLRHSRESDPKHPYTFEIESHGSKESPFQITVDHNGSFFGSTIKLSKLDLENYTPEPEPPAFDPTKPVQTRDGRKARILCTDRKGIKIGADYPIVALVDNGAGTEDTRFYTVEGRMFKCPADPYNPHDLINIPEEYTMWTVYYRPQNLSTVFVSQYATEAEALEKTRNLDRLAIVPVTFRNGDGLPEPK